MQMNPEVLLRLAHDQQARIMNLEGEIFALRETLKREVEQHQAGGAPMQEATPKANGNGFDKMRERMKDLPTAS